VEVVMAIIEGELGIVNLDCIFKLELTLPEYQRPYRWVVKSSNMLFTDIYNAFKNNAEEYRFGTIILHHDGDKYNIVDGQQRLTTLSIMLYCLGYEDINNISLLKVQYNELSNEAIVNNYDVLADRIQELSDNERSEYTEFLLNKCTIVKIVTDSEQDAFQFFDSQNSRGKELAPHDLLKSYHLREMSNEDEESKVKIINQWEDRNQNDLSQLFENYLFPLTQWYKGKDGLNYTSKKIDSFKGIKSNNVSNFAIYHKASNLYIEQFNSNGTNELLASNKLNQFQLTQQLIAGGRFFNYSLHYTVLLEKVQDKIKNFSTLKRISIPQKGTGDTYIKVLYECVLLFFVDRFGFENLSDSILLYLYKWSYSLRIVMSAVYKQTINNYAQGRHDRINNGLAMFTIISEISSPEGLKLCHLDSIDTCNNPNYQSIFNLITG
jgi:uncharacterized protein with ParB-like and HNH nuclease domain